MPPILVIYNPTAGRGRTQESWPLVKQALDAANLQYEAVATQARHDATALAQKAYGRYSAIVGVGGDGTVHEIVNGLLRGSNEGETLPLGIIPLGNGDDFAKVLPPATNVGSKPFDWQTGVEKVLRGKSELFDAGRMQADIAEPGFGSPHYFMNIIDVGFGAMATMNFTTIPKVFKGMSAYLLTVLKTMIRYPIIPLRVQLDREPPFDQTITMLTISNGRCFGNGFWITPDASAQDGLLDVARVKKIGRLKILNLIPKIMKGAHTNEPVVKISRHERVVLESVNPLVVEADGELPFKAAHRLEVDILPNRLRVLV